MAEVNMEELLNCALCPNICRCECPALQVLKREAVAPAGKARLAAMLQKKQLKWDDQVLEAVASCLGCKGCTIYCPFAELSLCDELLSARQTAKAAGARLSNTDPYLANLRKFGSPYGQKTEPLAAGESGAAVLFFAGCTSLANHRASVRAACSLLEKAGVQYQVVDEDCCGFPAEVWGDEKLARQLAGENRRKFEESGAKTLVTNCPECWLTFTQTYPARGITLPLEVIDGPTYFLELLQNGSLKPKAYEKLKISYHDPCIWARAAEKVNEPREILKLIPGLSVEEPSSYGAHTRCCGGGNMFQLSFPAVASAIADRRLEQFPQDAAIVTACPFCREGLLKNGRQVLELVELLASSCLPGS